MWVQVTWAKNIKERWNEYWPIYKKKNMVVGLKVNGRIQIILARFIIWLPYTNHLTPISISVSYRKYNLSTKYKYSDTDMIKIKSIRQVSTSEQKLLRNQFSFRCYFLPILLCLIFTHLFEVQKLSKDFGLDLWSGGQFYKT